MKTLQEILNKYQESISNEIDIKIIEGKIKNIVDNNIKIYREQNKEKLSKPKI